MPLHLLMTAQLPALVIDALERDFRLHRLWEAENADALIAEIEGHVEAIVTAVPILAESAGPRVDGALMARFSRLRLVANLGVGYDNIDAEWAFAHAVALTNTPDVLTEETADTAFGLLLNTVRELSAAERYLRAGKWLERPYRLTASLRGRTLGVFGLGRIGKAIARRAEAFGLTVIYHNRRPVPDIGYRYCPDLLELARACDILMVAAPGGPETDGLIGAEALDALGPDGVLINIARGSIVDEDALIAALREGRIHGAGLDVFAREPEVPPALLEADRVVLLPHVGSASQVTRDAMCQLVIDNVRRWAEGLPLLTPVRPTGGV